MKYSRKRGAIPRDEKNIQLAMWIIYIVLFYLFFFSFAVDFFKRKRVPSNADRDRAISFLTTKRYSKCMDI